MSGQIQDGATPFASVECENNPACIQYCCHHLVVFALNTHKRQ